MNWLINWIKEPKKYLFIGTQTFLNAVTYVSQKRIGSDYQYGGLNIYKPKHQSFFIWFTSFINILKHANLFSNSNISIILRYKHVPIKFKKIWMHFKKKRKPKTKKRMWTLRLKLIWNCIISLNSRNLRTEEWKVSWLARGGGYVWYLNKREGNVQGWWSQDDRISLSFI